MYETTYEKIRKSIPNTDASIITRIADECFDRMHRLNFDKTMLLDDNVTITINNDTNEIDIRQNELFGIFWSFDVNTGELVGT
jgi:hypothetical protein